VAPEELDSQDFNWQKGRESLVAIHSALQEDPGHAKKHLLKAFSCAHSAANDSYESLSYNETVARNTGEDWTKFFGAFRKDAWDVYRDHNTVNIDGKTIDLLDEIINISRAADDVFWALRDFFAPKEQDPVPSARRPAVEKLEMLIRALKLAEQMLPLIRGQGRKHRTPTRKTPLKAAPSPLTRQQPLNQIISFPCEWARVSRQVRHPPPMSQTLRSFL